jgi:peptidoglycan/xylan/chitin deacetylase (PgdA/CDA1 family)
VIRSLRGSSHSIALSFDDGPSPANTPEILAMLRSHGAHATFFFVGQEVRRYPDLAAEVMADGHEVGNHLWSHLNPLDLDASELRRQVSMASDEIAKVGTTPRLYRPPYGKRASAATVTFPELGLVPVLWSIDSGDTAGFSAPRVAREVVRRARSGDIVLLHDGGERRPVTLDATRMILEQLRGRGYEFVTVSSLIAATR